MNDEDRARTLPERLQLLYSSCVTEIAGFKQQQWKTTNYAILVYAAIVSIAKTTKPLNEVEWFVLFAGSIAVLVSASFVIKMLAGSIRTRRTRLTKIRKHFRDDFMIAWGCGKPLEEIIDNPNEKSRLDWFFYTILGLGFTATVWLLMHQVCIS